MSSRHPHRGTPLPNRIILQHGGLLRAAHKGIEEQELPPPPQGEKLPREPGIEEGEKDPDFVPPSTQDKMPTYQDKAEHYPDPSFEKGIPGPEVTPPDEEDI